MPETVPQPMSVEAFFAWQERQAERYELVGGLTVRMMADARNVHDDIMVNLLAALHADLRGSGCRPFTGDGSVDTLPNQIRRPDAGVDCGKGDPAGMKAADPRLVAEVLSPSPRDFDAFEKLAEYWGIACLDHVLLIEPNAAEVMLWSRDVDRAWVKARITGLDALADLTGLNIRLALADLYDGVVFPVRPCLVQDEPPGGPAA